MRTIVQQENPDFGLCKSHEPLLAFQIWAPVENSRENIFWIVDNGTRSEKEVNGGRVISKPSVRRGCDGGVLFSK